MAWTHPINMVIPEGRIKKLGYPRITQVRRHEQALEASLSQECQPPLSQVLLHQCIYIDRVFNNEPTVAKIVAGTPRGSGGGAATGGVATRA